MTVPPHFHRDANDWCEAPYSGLVTQNVEPGKSYLIISIDIACHSTPGLKHKAGISVVLNIQQIFKHVLRSDSNQICIAR